MQTESVPSTGVPSNRLPVSGVTTPARQKADHRGANCQVMTVSAQTTGREIPPTRVVFAMIRVLPWLLGAYFGKGSGRQPAITRRTELPGGKAGRPFLRPEKRGSYMLPLALSTTMAIIPCEGSHPSPIRSPPLYPHCTAGLRGSASAPSGAPSPSVSGLNGSVPRLTSAPSLRPSPSVSGFNGSVPRLTSAASLRPSPSVSGAARGFR